MGLLAFKDRHAAGPLGACGGMALYIGNTGMPNTDPLGKADGDHVLTNGYIILVGCWD